jgi:hypothetical protein
MTIIREISAEILQGINPLRPALQGGVSRLIIHSSEALEALKNTLQSELLWDYLSLVAAVWILSSAAMVCFWFGWVLGTNIYGVGMWFMGRSVVTQRRVRMVAKHASGKRKLGGKKASPAEVSRSDQIQVSEEAGHIDSLVADNTSRSDSQKEAICATSRSSTVLSHPGSAFEIGDSTPDKTHHMHAPVKPLAVLANQETASGNVTGTFFSHANTPSEIKKKSATAIVCATMDGLAESPISTAKGMAGLLTPPVSVQLFN